MSANAVALAARILSDHVAAEIERDQRYRELTAALKVPPNMDPNVNGLYLWSDVLDIATRARAALDDAEARR